MAQFGRDWDNFRANKTIKIIDTETVDTYTVYVVAVTLGPYTWTVKHRYSSFHDLHEKLCSSCKLDRNLLPPKKLFGNQTEAFIKKRQADLEVYLQTVLYYVGHKIPGALASFLNFSQYEIHGITHTMAEELYNRGDSLLQTRDFYRTTPLHLHSLRERLKLPEPTCDSGDVKRDLGHILDFITRLKCLQVSGGQPVGTSNIDMNQLEFDLTLFKSLQKLELVCCDIEQIGGLDTVKQTVQSLTVNNTLSSIKSVLLQDLPHWKAEDGTVVTSYWDHLTFVDLSHNKITEIDDCVQLMPRCVELNLCHNQITTIQHLQWLSHLTYLDLSHNAIQQLEALHSKLGNLKTLNLAGNQLESLQGLSKLFSLENLDVSKNEVKQIDDIKAVCSLPCIENLLLIGNPVTITLDYRTKTLALFGDRVKEVRLDREMANQKELDTVAVLQAIQKSRDKAKQIQVKKVSSTASINDISSQSPSASVSRVHTNSQSSGNQVRETTPLMKKYNLFSVSRISGDLESSYSSFPSTLSGYQGERERMESLNSGVGVPSSLTLAVGSYTSRQRSSFHSTTASVSSNSLVDHGHRISQSSSPHVDSILPSGSHLVNISSLPNHTNTDFYSALHSRLFGKKDDSVNTSELEKILHVLWCPVVQYSNSFGTLVPCCVVLTERRIFILQLKSTKSVVDGVPDMETFYILPLCNIQQIVIGLCYSYIRVEEAFVGASGTFALLAGDTDSGKQFYDEFKAAFEGNSENGQLDVVNGCQNSGLSKQIFDLEEEKDECTGRIAFAAHVHFVESGNLMYLVLSENQAYIVKTDVMFWPKPTFDTNSAEVTMKFDIAQQFSVEGKISEIKMFIVNGNVDPIRDKKPVMTPTYNIRFEEYGLSMVFHELLGSHKFNFSFFTTRARDAFLNHLTSLRSEHAHRMSPTLREEPEGCNESSETSSDNQPMVDSEKNQNGAVESENLEYIYGENQSEDESAEEEDELVHSLTRPPKQPRKLRSKTEIVISRSSISSDGSRELPSYTWHYLSPELIRHLETGIRQYTLFQTLSPKLKAFTEMSGEDLAQYFHTNIVPVGVEGEELHHISWTNVIPYTSPNDELVTCVMLSNRAVYFVSDKVIRLQTAQARPSWMTHARHVSDSVIGLHAKMADQHHCSGILHSSEQDGAIVKPYCILDFSEIQQINVGLFDQCLRLTGSTKENVFTLVMRSSEATSAFLKNMSTMLSLYVSSPMLDNSGDYEQDFYKTFNKRTKTTMEGMEYVHPSKVKFCYPGDEAITDLLFVINEHLKSISLKVGRDSILQYVLGYRVQSVSHVLAPVLLEPISIILTNECLCFVTEDLVSYPLPDFVRGLPGTPRQKVTDVKKLEYLKYVKQPSEASRELILVFSDEKEDIILVHDHYSIQENDGQDSIPEVQVRMFIQSERELTKFLLLLKSQWREKHPNHDQELPVTVG